MDPLKSVPAKPGQSIPVELGSEEKELRGLIHDIRILMHDMSGESITISIGDQFDDKSTAVPSIVVRERRVDDDDAEDRVPGSHHETMSDVVAINTADASRLIGQEIDTHLPAWQAQFPTIQTAILCREEAANSSFFVAAYVHGPANYAGFPTSVFVDGIGDVPVHRFAFRRPTETHSQDLGRRTAATNSDDVDRAKVAIRTHTPALFRRINVRAVTAGFRPDGSVCMFVYVHHLGVVQGEDEPLPRVLDGLPVIFTESTWMRSFGERGETQDCVRPLCGGVRIHADLGLVPGSSWGTIGAIVASSDGSRYALTCAHVLGKNCNARVYQPRKPPLLAPAGDSMIFNGTGAIDISFHGNVADGSPTIDSALFPVDAAQTGPGYACSAKTWAELSEDEYFGARPPPEYNPDSLPTVSADVFDITALTGRSLFVFKVGGASQLTFGETKEFIINSRPTTISPRNVMADGDVYYNQVVVSGVPQDVPFSIRGDSGSLVYVLDGAAAKPVGIVVAGSGGDSIVTPLTAVMTAASKRIPFPVILT